MIIATKHHIVTVVVLTLFVFALSSVNARETRAVGRRIRPARKKGAKVGKKQKENSSAPSATPTASVAPSTIPTITAETTPMTPMTIRLIFTISTDGNGVSTGDMVSLITKTSDLLSANFVDIRSRRNRHLLGVDLILDVEGVGKIDASVTDLECTGVGMEQMCSVRIQVEFLIHPALVPPCTDLAGALINALNTDLPQGTTVEDGADTMY
jgi:hypothetical protein